VSVLDPSSLGSLTWREVDAQPKRILVLAIGSMEQHGPHLPLATDSIVADYLARRLVASRDDALYAGLVPFGSSGEHQDFSGTLSVGTEPLAAFLVELVRSARPWSLGTVMISGHGGNADALASVVATARHEGDRVVGILPKTSSGDAHAGRTETSILALLAPDYVRDELAEAGNLDPLRDLADKLRQRGVRAVSENGVLGDPSGATAREGQAVLDEMFENLVEEVRTTFGP
jgi:mycofactocin precursor peptide peptidase